MKVPLLGGSRPALSEVPKRPVPDERLCVAKWFLLAADIEPDHVDDPELTTELRE